jgi:hypothetical protein
VVMPVHPTVETWAARAGLRGVAGPGGGVPPRGQWTLYVVGFSKAAEVAAAAL